MLLHYKRLWFLQRTLHRLHPHDHQKQELAETWIFDIEDRVGKYISANHSKSFALRERSFIAYIGMRTSRIAFVDSITIEKD